MSCFAIVQFWPASVMEYPKFLAEDIFTRSKSFLLMLSLKLLPLGNETFMQILVLEGWGTAKMEFALKPGNGGVENGPAMNFFSTQDAIVSVTFAPNRNAFFEFLRSSQGVGEVGRLEHLWSGTLRIFWLLQVLI
jgi:hypothetical protein